MSDIDPARLDELLAGDPPRTDAERDVLHMAAALRGAAPSAPDALRERVMTTAREAAPTRRGFRLPGMGPSMWMGPAAAGIAAVVIGAAVVLPGLRGDDPLRPATTAGFEAAQGTGPTSAGGPEATLAPGPGSPRVAAPPAPEVAPSAPEASPADVRGAPQAVVLGPADGWPATALERVADPVEESGGVVTGATTGTAADGREDLQVEALVPPARRDAAVEAILEALPADPSWAPSETAREAVGADGAGDNVRPDGAAKNLAGADAVPVTVVVVRDATP